MAKLIFSMNQSLDGYVNHDKFGPGPVLFRHFVDQVGGLAGSLYGTRLYEIMRYWDNEEADWGPEEREFANVWRAQPKWVVSHSLKEVGPNATLATDDLETTARRLKAEVEGEIDVAGPNLAGQLTALGLIDEYRMYLHPVVLGEGDRFFTGPRPRLRLASNDIIEGVVRLTYVPE